LAVRDVNSTQDLEEKFGDKVITVQADVSDTASIQALAQQTTDVDIVVNKGVGPLNQSLVKMLKRFCFQLEVNAWFTTCG
jgi:NADP-dependent 3-hydroxy acid dehydrogenase YdfG